MTIDEIIHRLQVLKDGGYIWLAQSSIFYRYRDGVLERSLAGYTSDPVAFVLTGDIDHTTWVRADRDGNSLVRVFVPGDLVFQRKSPTSAPTRQVRAIEL